jgi:hypothetical protein
MNKEFIDTLWKNKESNPDKEYELIKTQKPHTSLGKLNNIVFTLTNKRPYKSNISNYTEKGIFIWRIQLVFSEKILEYNLKDSIEGKPPGKYIDAMLNYKGDDGFVASSIRVNYFMDPDKSIVTPDDIKIEDEYEYDIRYTYDEFNSKKQERYFLDVNKLADNLNYSTLIKDSIAIPSDHYLELEKEKEKKKQTNNNSTEYKIVNTYHGTYYYNLIPRVIDGVTNYTLDTTDMIQEKVSNISTQGGGKRYRKRKSTKHSRKHRAKRTRGRKSRR